MHTLEYISFDNLASTNDLISAIRKKVSSQSKGYCVVRNNAINADSFMLLLHEQLATSLSMSKKGGLTIPYDLVKDKGDQMDKAGALLSFTNELFPLHTDCCFLERCPDLIALYCAENSEKGGENTLLNINDVIHLLPPAYIESLLTTSFKFYSKEYRILEKEGGIFFARFHQGELLDSCPPAERNECLSHLQLLLDLLNNQALFTTVKLEPNDCIIVNNRTCLHGRYAFEQGSKRTFYRSRHYLSRE